MALWINQYKYLLLIGYAALAIMLSAVIREDAFMYLNMAIAGVAATYVLLKKDILLLLSILILSIFNEGITQFNVTYIIFYLYALMCISIFTNKEKNKLHVLLAVSVTLALILSIVPALVNGTTVPLLLMSALKRFGFFIVFLFALNMISLDRDYRKILDASVIVVLSMNFLLAVLQFFQGELTQDFITGIMGAGTTGIFIYLLMFYLAIASGLHYSGKISTFSYMGLALIPIIYSAIAEVKIGFISTLVLLVIYLLFIKKGFKAFALFVAACFVLVGSYSYFVTLYPNHDFLNKEFLESYLVEQSYGEGNTLNRFGFKPTVDAVVFSNNSNEMIFGKGLGSGNPSESEMLQGEVYKKFDFLKYSWFLLPYLYIESGMLGSILYLFIYLIPLVIAIRQFMIRKSSLAIVVLLMGLTNILFIPYNIGLFSYGVMVVFWVYTAMLIQEIYTQQTVEKE